MSDANAPIKLSAWSLGEAEKMIEEWRHKPDLSAKSADYAGKAGAMWVLAFMLIGHIRALEAELELERQN